MMFSVLKPKTRVRQQLLSVFASCFGFRSMLLPELCEDCMLSRTLWMVLGMFQPFVESAQVFEISLGVLRRTHARSFDARLKRYQTIARTLGDHDSWSSPGGFGGRGVASIRGPQT